MLEVHAESQGVIPDATRRDAADDGWVGEWVDVTLRLELEPDVPRGEIVVLGAPERFRGWLQLLERLEEVRSAARLERDEPFNYQ